VSDNQTNVTRRDIKVRKPETPTLPEIPVKKHKQIKVPTPGRYFIIDPEKT
jgi:hypothetical protein